MDIHVYVIQSRSKLGLKRYIFIEKNKIISLTNLFQHLLFRARSLVVSDLRSETKGSRSECAASYVQS